MLGFKALASLTLLSFAASQSTGNASYNTDSTGFGKCSLPGGTYPKWTSVGPATFAGASVCGACLEVTNTENNQKTIVHVVDQCLACGPGDLNMSLEAFTSIGEQWKGRIPVSWNVVRCPDISGNIQYSWQTGSNQWWGAFQLRNHAEAIKTVEYSKNNGASWTNIPRREDNYWVTSGIAGPYSVRITSTSGKTVVDQNITPLEAGGDVNSSGQF